MADFDNTPEGRRLEGEFLGERNIPVEQKPDEAWYHFNDRKNAAENVQKNR
jgi:hypothetical protein